MPYLVDGHNLLAQTPGLSLRRPDDRRRLLQALAGFSRARRCRITVVFDGDPVPGWRDELHLGAVRVLHSGAGRTADTALLELIRSSRRPADMILVTSDRSLHDKGRHLGARGMRGHVFRKMMAEGSGRGARPSEKPERSDPEELAYFMELFEGSAGDRSRSTRRR